MSIPPKYHGVVKAIGSVTSASSTPLNTIDLFLDFVCPFSAKLFLNFEKNLLPKVEEKFPNKFQFVIRPQVQPWHAPGSAATSEVFVALLKSYPEKSWALAKTLMANQSEFFDTAIIDLTRNELYKKIISVVKKFNAFVEEDKIYDLVKIRSKLPSETDYTNVNSEITNDLKYFVRFNRALSINVTPTVAVNGVIVGNIESSTSIDNVLEILKTYV